MALHASNGILFNHEGPTRGETFVTRKITVRSPRLNSDCRRRCFSGILTPSATGGMREIMSKACGEFCSTLNPMIMFSRPARCIRCANSSRRHLHRSEYALDGQGRVLTKPGLMRNQAEFLVKIDPRYFRPTEVDLLIGDASKARAKLGWQHRVSFDELVAEMVAADLKERCRREITCPHRRRLSRPVNSHSFDLAGKRVFVAGHTGMAGSAIVRRLRQEPCTVLVADRSELDLTRQDQTERYLSATRPDVVIMAAGRVGGILANDRYPANFLADNLAMALNCIHVSHLVGVQKLLFLGSSCIYPKFAKQPMSEDQLLTGELEPTNEWYAIAKIAGIKLCEAYRRQYGRDFISVMPTNLYGPGDNYHPEHSHVVAALIRRFHEAKIENASTVVVWGTGTPRREFLYVDDFADACVFVLKNYSGSQFINIGCGEDMTIAEFARTVAEVVGFRGEIVYDTSKPDGTPRNFSTFRGFQLWAGRPRFPCGKGSESLPDFLTYVVRER